MRPVPPRANIDRRSDPRIRNAQRLAAVLTFLAPVIRRIHDLDPLGPEECAPLLRNTFLLAWEMSPDYRAWFLRQPASVIETAYREYRQQLQLLYWQRPHDGHWVLKTPLHLYGVEALLTLFPDAAIVLIHRDPVRVIPSACSLASLLLEAVTDDPERRAAVGPRVATWVAEGLRRVDAARADAPAGRIYDVRYHDLIADPLGAVKRLYAHFGYPYTEEFEARAERWLKENPQNKHGAHRYNLEQFGLDRRMIDDRFSWYCTRHQIPSES
jgi:hypothetical protein